MAPAPEYWPLRREGAGRPGDGAGPRVVASVAGGRREPPEPPGPPRLGRWRSATDGVGPRVTGSARGCPRPGVSRVRTGSLVAEVVSRRVAGSPGRRVAGVAGSQGSPGLSGPR